jgi:hypothetical protein
MKITPSFTKIVLNDIFKEILPFITVYDMKGSEAENYYVNSSFELLTPIPKKDMELFKINSYDESGGTDLIPLQFTS